MITKDLHRLEQMLRNIIAKTQVDPEASEIFEILKVHRVQGIRVVPRNLNALEILVIKTA